VRPDGWKAEETAERFTTRLYFGSSKSRAWWPQRRPMAGTNARNLSR